MDYIFLFLGVILIVQGAMSIYIYTEIKEERATQNFQNYQSTLNDRGNKDSPDYWHERHD